MIINTTHRSNTYAPSVCLCLYYRPVCLSGLPRALVPWPFPVSLPRTLFSCHCLLPLSRAPAPCTCHHVLALCPCPCPIHALVPCPCSVLSMPSLRAHTCDQELHVGIGRGTRMDGKDAWDEKGKRGLKMASWELERHSNCWKGHVWGSEGHMGVLRRAHWCLRSTHTD